MQKGEPDGSPFCCSKPWIKPIQEAIRFYSEDSAAAQLPPLSNNAAGAP